MLQRLDSLLNLQPQERRTVYLMLAQYFFFGAAMLFAQSASMPLFLKYWDSSAIPITYIGIAVVVSGITAVFLKIAERVSLARWLWLTLLFLTLVTLGLRAGLWLAPSKWLALILPIWTQTLINLAVLAFWTLAADIFDVRQGKRLFGLLNAGSWLSYVVAGPFTGVIASSLGTDNLYVIIAACLFAGLLLQSLVLRGAKPTHGLPSSGQEQKQPSLGALLTNRYILLIFGLAALWRVAYFVLDAIFYSTASVQFPDTAQNSGFIGLFFSAVGVFGFITDTFLTGRILSRFGLWAGLLATPIALILSMSGFTAVGLFAASWTTGLFWFSVAGKFNNESLGFTLDQSASSLLYQPIADTLRPKARAIGEGIVQPAAIGIAGLLLTLLGGVLHFDLVQLALVYLCLAIAWLALGTVLAGAYPRALVEALTQRRIRREALFDLSAVSEQVLTSGIRSPHAGSVIYSLDLLERSGNSGLPQWLAVLVEHESPEVRRAVMERIERVKPEAMNSMLVRRIRDEDSSYVRLGAVQALAAVNPGNEQVLLPYLNSKRESERIGALMGLARHGGEQGWLLGMERLQGLLHDEKSSNRAAAARILGEAAQAHSHDMLLTLLDDPDLEVLRAALNAAGRTVSAELWPVLLTKMNDPATRAQAAEALEAGGDTVLPLLAESLAREESPLAVRVKLAKTCGNIGSAPAAAVLAAYLDHPDAALREAVLAGLTECAHRADKADERVQAQVQAETREAVELLAALRDLASAPETQALRRAIGIELGHIRERLLHLLGFIHDREAILNARRVLARRDPRKLAFALEALDTVLPREIKKIILPLAEDLDAEERLKRMDAAPERQPAAARLARLAERQDWIGACASACLKKGNPMEAIVERVLILKSVNLFSRVPDDALAELAEVLTEIRVPAGATIVEKGEAGSSLFIIVSGRVTVLNGSQVLNTLGERDVFGELSLLDTEPRSATIRAETNTSLLRLDQEPFYEVLADRFDVAMGTIQMLTANLRARVGEVMSLHEQLGQTRA